MRITTLIPCYNASNHIDECLQSVLAQTRRVDDIIVVDDCSTDDTRKRLGRYLGVRLLTTEKNSGHATARNMGIREATGDVIAWLDADDYWEPNHIETVVDLLEKHPAAAVAFSGVRQFGTVTKVWNQFPCNGSARSIFAYAIQGTPVPAMSAVTRTEAIRAVKGYDETIRIAPDFDLWLRMSLRYKFVSTSDVTSNYRWHSGQISSTKHHEQIASMIRSRFGVLKSLVDTGQSEEAHQLAEANLNAWTMHLWKAWSDNDKDALRLFLSLAEFVPDGKELFEKFNRRLLIPTAIVPSLQWFVSLISKRRDQISSSTAED